MNGREIGNGADGPLLSIVQAPHLQLATRRLDQLGQRLLRDFPDDVPRLGFARGGVDQAMGLAPGHDPAAANAFTNGALESSNLLAQASAADARCQDTRWSRGEEYVAQQWSVGGGNIVKEYGGHHSVRPLHPVDQVPRPEVLHARGAQVRIQEAKTEE